MGIIDYRCVLVCHSRLTVDSLGEVRVSASHTFSRTPIISYFSFIHFCSERMGEILLIGLTFMP